MTEQQISAQKFKESVITMLRDLLTQVKSEVITVDGVDVKFSGAVCGEIQNATMEIKYYETPKQLPRRMTQAEIYALRYERSEYLEQCQGTTQDETDHLRAIYAVSGTVQEWKEQYE